MPDPIDPFKWTGQGGPKEVRVHMLEEGPLADANTRVELRRHVQEAGAASDTLAAFEGAVKGLAQEAGLDATFQTQLDHSNPLGQLVTIGLVPHVEPGEAMFAWA